MLKVSPRNMKTRQSLVQRDMPGLQLTASRSCLLLLVSESKFAFHVPGQGPVHFDDPRTASHISVVQYQKVYIYIVLW
jgi:hypothetical protein